MNKIMRIIALALCSTSAINAMDVPSQSATEQKAQTSSITSQTTIWQRVKTKCLPLVGKYWPTVKTYCKANPAYVISAGLALITSTICYDAGISNPFTAIISTCLTKAPATALGLLALSFFGYKLSQ